MKYSFIYHVNATQVHSDSKPKDCEWDFAPLGVKGCHYEKRVDILRDSERGPVTSVWVTWDKVKE
jgi:hypothetical protein